MKEKNKLVPSYRVLVAAVAALFIYSFFVTVALSWVFVTVQKLDERIERFETMPCKSQPDKDPILQSPKTPENIEDSIVSVEDNRREVLNSGSLNLAEILKQGIQGPPGPPGKDGSPGIPGTPGTNGRDGRDAISLDIINRSINNSVALSVSSEMKKVEAITKSIPVISGAVYIRWGKTSCRSTAKLMIQGITAAPDYSVSGGGAEYLCLPDDPQYQRTSFTEKYGFSRVSGAEYHHVYNRVGKASQTATNMHDENAPCAYCVADQRSQKLMLPARLSCPAGWTFEYAGNLMSEGTFDSSFKGRTSYICVDIDMEAVPGQNRNTNGALLQYVVANCGTGDATLGYCPPYRGDIRISCVVCTK